MLSSFQIHDPERGIGSGPVTPAPAPSPSPPPALSTYAGAFTSYDRLERCYADDAGAVCVAAPSGKLVRMSQGFASYDGQGDRRDLGGRALPMGQGFTTPSGVISCTSSSRGVTCVDSSTGAYFVIGDYTVVVNNGYGERRY
jgi:hypothetical protein